MNLVNVAGKSRQHMRQSLTLTLVKPEYIQGHISDGPVIRSADIKRYCNDTCLPLFKYRFGLKENDSVVNLVILAMVPAFFFSFNRK